MSIEKAKNHLKKYGLDEKIREFEVSGATVELAAIALNCEPKRIAKTLSFKIGDECILIVTSGTLKSTTQNIKQNSTQKQKCLLLMRLNL